MRRVVAAAWAKRQQIELSAAGRFGLLARRMAELHAPDALVTLAADAVEQEQRHAVHCERYVRHYGGTPLPAPQGVIEYAPRKLQPVQRLIYEMVAQACVAETQGATTLVTLMQEAETPELRAVIQELARDEVNHSRLGWGFLAWVRERADLGFLGAWLPGMLTGSSGQEAFPDEGPDADSPELLHHGVIPLSRRKQLYAETMEQVVLPGFEQQGVDSGPARAWFAQWKQDNAAR